MNDNDLDPTFGARLDTDGWFIAPRAIGEPVLDAVCAQLEPALALREAIRTRNHVEGANDGTLHHLLGDDDAFLALLEALRPFEPLLRWFFSGRCILNSYGGVINRKDGTAYVHNVHRDIRFASDTRRFMLNLLVMLDEFTPENGATHVLTGSHREPEQPDAARFATEAQRATGPRGSVLFFDSRLWHAAGSNVTGKPRRALTLTFTSPFFKQQLDYPRLLGQESRAAADPFLRQLVGYNARVPATLDDYYVPVAERFYQRGQDD
ncbi:MAG: phytanoyl-CoA dioxygenase family protein [Ramlibacter sp.]|nr:phytanoyl-CoA dioxygenase family protein [Ramlibacter sp.]